MFKPSNYTDIYSEFFRKELHSQIFKQDTSIKICTFFREIQGNLFK